jgi:hypothetical protein
MRELIFLRDDVDEADVAAAADGIGYVPDVFIKQEPDAPFELHFIHPQKTDTTVAYIKNHQLRVDYVLILGPQSASIRAALEKVLSHYDHDNVYDRAASDPDLDERVRALFHLALARGSEADARVLRLLGEFLHHKVDGMRRAGVLAAAYLSWPEVEPLLEDLIARETNPQISHDAKHVYSRLPKP